MGASIRVTTSEDAPLWLDLVQAALGDNYPSREIYDPAWIASQLDSTTGPETWVVDNDGRLMASASFLKADPSNVNPVANLGRLLFRPESMTDGSADGLIHALTEMATQRNEMVVVRVSALDNAQQILFENNGYVCCGFQPLKHLIQQRIGVLFYVRGASSILVTRSPLSESLPAVSELATVVLEQMQISNPMAIRDGATGYPLQAELKVHEASAEDFELWHLQAQAENPPIEISGRFNLGFGLLRFPAEAEFHSLLAQKGDKMIAGLCYYFDVQDRCARVTQGFCCDDLSMGALLAHAVKIVQEQMGAVYTEVDILATAPRLLKSAEQMGFVPVAYMPAFFCQGGSYADVVKLIKLNVAYSLDTGEFTAHARAIMEIIDRNFQDQKMGTAIIALLRGLAMFDGLGDGELRKVARLFNQKLYRPNEEVFAKGDSGNEAYIVLRGKIDIKLERDGQALAQLGDGKIFGEMAFLDGAPRGALAIANTPSILLVVQRDSFNELVQREPHLGMVIMRNLALDLGVKLRSANEQLAAARKK